MLAGLTKLTRTSLESSFLMAGLTKPTNSRFWRLIQKVSRPKETKGNPQEANGFSKIFGRAHETHKNKPWIFVFDGRAHETHEFKVLETNSNSQLSKGDQRKPKERVPHLRRQTCCALCASLHLQKCAPKLQRQICCTFCSAALCKPVWIQSRIQSRI